jgi:hypothetical protein
VEQEEEEKFVSYPHTIPSCMEGRKVGETAPSLEIF